MIRSLSLGFALLLVVALHGQPGHGQRPEPKPSDNKARWSSEEVFRELSRQPNDPYLQYVAVQLARREGRAQDAAQRLLGRRMFGAGRRERVDLFSTFTGALAVQESLQLDTLLGEDDRRRGEFRPSVEDKMVTPPPSTGVKDSKEKPAEKPPTQSRSKTAAKLR